MLKRALAAVAAGFLAFAFAVRGDGRAGQFTATAEVETSSGTRSMPLTIVVTDPMSPDDARSLKRLLKDRGQWGLAMAIRGGSRGSFRLGGLEYPIDLVIAEQIADGYKYIVITTRPLEFEEGKASLGRDPPITDLAGAPQVQIIRNRVATVVVRPARFERATFSSGG
jgi:hypothetical protein